MIDDSVSLETAVILAGDQRLSRSIIWEIQRQFFLSRGMAAWQEDIVPHYISSNPFMARAYSQVVLGYIRDCCAAKTSLPMDMNQPLYIIELGSGSGRLAYHLLHQLQPRLRQSPFANLPVKFIMTDFVPAILDFWQAHERLQPWVEAGLLDFALFDAQDPRPLKLVHANETLTAEQLKNPLVLIANYFFDSIPQDSFVIQEGQLCENLLSLYSSQPEPDFADPTIWDRLELAYEAIPLARPYYANPDYDQILNSYEEQLADTTLLFPNVALDCLQFWQALTGSSTLLLSSDKGYMLAESLLEQADPIPDLHGSFSMMVNYHAINQWVRQQGGLVLHPPHYQNNLQVAAYLLGEQPQNALETRQAFTEAVAQGGPDDFFSLKSALEPHYDSLTLPQLLSYLRFSGWDAAVLAACMPALLTQVRLASAVWYPDVYEVITQIWQQYLPLGEAADLAGDIGQLLSEMGYDDQLLDLAPDFLAGDELG